MLHLVSTLFFLLAAAFGLTVISVSLSENRHRILTALRGPARADQPRAALARARLMRA